MIDEIRPLPSDEKQALTEFFGILKEIDPTFDLEPIGWLRQELNLSLSVASDTEKTLYYFGTSLFCDEENNGEYGYDLLAPKGVDLKEGDSLVGTLFVLENEMEALIQTFNECEDELRSYE